MLNQSARHTKSERGMFITFEGIEGSGKSTVIKHIEQYLKTCLNIDCICTREFGGTEIAEKIRSVLLGHHEEKMSKKTEILLAFAARAQHMENLIIPTVNKGGWVLCDRFTDSSYAYQGYGRLVPINEIKEIEDWTQRGTKPDYTILFDVSVTVGMSRMIHRQKINHKGRDRIEQEDTEFFERVVSGYRQLAKNNLERFRVVDASKDVESVLQNVEVIFENFVEDQKRKKDK